LRIPVCASLGIATFTGMLAGGYPLTMTIMSLQATLESVNYLPIIFFILMGNIANSTELSERIFKFATDRVGHLRGGLAQANVVASMVFAGMSGSGIADCAGLGIVEMKAMTDFGYRRSFSAAVTAASAVVGPIIPPSISLVIYGALANVSITRVLLGGLVPGFFIGFVVMGLVYFLTASGQGHCPLETLTTISSALTFSLKGFRNRVLRKRWHGSGPRQALYLRR
jgi:tripartite ATP-independent transporter DctM subunit